MSDFLNHSTNYGYVNINIGTSKRERSPDTESDSSISSLEVKRTKKINYFLGHGEKEWIPKDELILDNINITNAFKKFRDQSIAAVKKSDYVNCLRVLSFSHIFPINTFNEEISVSRFFGKDTSKTLKQLSSQLTPSFQTASAKAVLYCKQVADEGAVGDDFDPESEMDSMITDLVTYKIQYRISIPKTSEATFSEKYIMPALRRVLLQDATEDLVYGMIDKSDHYGKKPDFMIGSKLKKEELLFFFVEIKRPNTTSKYQAEDDYTKLLKQMKQSVDKQLGLGMEDPISLGLLVEGFKCTLFLMKNIVHGVYAPVAIKRFTLVEEMHELVLLPSIVEALYFVKLELAKFTLDINKKRKRAEKAAVKARVCPSFITKFETKKA